MRRFDFARAVAVATLLIGFGLAGFAGGYWLGHETTIAAERRVAAALRDGPGTAEGWPESMERNDLWAALATCTGNRIAVAGGWRTRMVPRWLDGGMRKAP